MTALYLSVLRPEDRVAVKPHASPVFHAIQYLLGRKSRDNWRTSARSAARNPTRRAPRIPTMSISPPARSGWASASPCSPRWCSDYVRLHGLAGEAARHGRMVALMGDAELDEGNVFEALLEGWKHDVRNLWWVIDYNRHSLDGVVQRPSVRPHPRFLRHPSAGTWST